MCCHLQIWANNEPLLPLPTLKMEHSQLVCDVIRRADFRDNWYALSLPCCKCQCHRHPRGSTPTPTHSHTHTMSLDLGLFWVASSAASQVPSLDAADWQGYTLTHTICRYSGWGVLHCELVCTGLRLLAFCKKHEVKTPVLFEKSHSFWTLQCRGKSFFFNLGWITEG